MFFPISHDIYSRWDIIRYILIFQLFCIQYTSLLFIPGPKHGFWPPSLLASPSSEGQMKPEASLQHTEIAFTVTPSSSPSSIRYYLNKLVTLGLAHNICGWVRPRIKDMLFIWQSYLVCVIYKWMINIGSCPHHTILGHALVHTKRSK